METCADRNLMSWQMRRAVELHISSDLIPYGLCWSINPPTNCQTNSSGRNRKHPKIAAKRLINTLTSFKAITANGNWLTPARPTSPRMGMVKREKKLDHAIRTAVRVSQQIGFSSDRINTNTPPEWAAVVWRGSQKKKDPLIQIGWVGWLVLWSARNRNMATITKNEPSKHFESRR